MNNTSKVSQPQAALSVTPSDPGNPTVGGRSEGSAARSLTAGGRRRQSQGRGGRHYGGCWEALRGSLRRSLQESGNAGEPGPTPR